MDKLLAALGKPWKVIIDIDGRAQLYRDDHIYMTAPTRDILFWKFAVMRPFYGVAGEIYFGIPDSLASKSEEELLLKLEVMSR